MRHLILALTLICIPAAAAAQSSALDEGSLLVYGNASFTSTGGDGSDDRFTSLSVRPGVKYFVVPGLAVGGQLQIGYSANDDFSAIMLGVGPSADYYFGDLDAAVHPFISATTVLSWSSTEGPSFESESRVVTLHGEAGLLYLLSEQVGLTTALFYETRNFEGGSASVGQNVFGLSMGLSAFVF